ncbi:hypothetical protein F4780DRAFT_319986 [Xylariomycetidae sp. FL0641]|nr:hypothetical protein F4780DRAFT_319986 [Xylariomycetidae sp. FL0641]
MSFGYSVGDLITGANLTRQLIRTLSDSRGACIEYQEALTELRAVEDAFIHTGTILQSNLFERDASNGIACIVLASLDTIEKFHQRTQNLQQRLRSSRNGVESSWTKVGWQLFGKDELRDLTRQLNGRLTSIDVLIKTATYRKKMPSIVAQYEDKDSGHHEVKNAVDQPMAIGSHPASTSVHPLADQAALAEMAHTPDNEHNPTIHERDSTISYEPTALEMNGSPMPTYGSTPVGNNQLGLLTPPSTWPTPKTPTTSENGRVPAITRESLPVGVNSKDSFATPRSAVGEMKGGGESIPLTLKQQIRAEIEAEDAAIAAADQAAAQAAQVGRDISSIMQMVTALREKELEKEEKAAKAKEVKAPIRFKDAVGRKFSFPFHLCQTWQGIEELIKQAFLHVDVIGPHVEHGHYDLIGPEGEIILPQVWEKVVAPDWSVTMHMWPMPERSSRPPQPPPRPPQPPPRPPQPSPRPPQPPPQPAKPPSSNNQAPYWPPFTNPQSGPRPQPPPPQTGKPPPPNNQPQYWPPFLDSFPVHPGDPRYNGSRPQEARAGPQLPRAPKMTKPPNSRHFNTGSAETNRPLDPSQYLEGSQDPSKFLEEALDISQFTDMQRAADPLPFLDDAEHSTASNSHSSASHGSEFALLDDFEPDWRRKYADLILEQQLTEAFIAANQPQIIAFLQRVDFPSSPVAGKSTESPVRPEMGKRRPKPRFAVKSSKAYVRRRSTKKAKDSRLGSEPSNSDCWDSETPSIYSEDWEAEDGAFP